MGEYIIFFHSLVIFTNVISDYYHYLVTGRWFSPGLPVSSTNKTYRHDITEIVLKVALNTIKQTNKYGVEFALQHLQIL